MKKIMFLLLISIFIFPINGYCESLDLTPNAKSSILMEVTTKEIIFEKNSEERVSVASLTKMMGLILFFETLEQGGITYEEKVTVSENAKNMGGTQIYLETGEKISVEDLIKGIVMASANDAIVELAERLAGTEDAFIARMNAKAKELGLTNTNFKNVVGFDQDDHYSTAYDMALIAIELLKHEDILKFSSVYEDYIREDTENKTWVVNTNKLVRFYQGADGLKTGYDTNAGSCMAVTAKRDNLRFIAISLGYDKNTVRNEEAKAMLDYGFNIYKMNILEEKGTIIGNTKLEKAKLDTIDLVLKEDASVLEKKTDTDKKYNFETKLSDLEYPVKKGDTIGYLEIKSNGKIIKKVPLVTNTTIEKAGLMFLYLKNLKEIVLGIN
ncbi:MAG TPA: D-alanyl-D-alanine carboxypeptidase family protein [Bacilli bacterium]|nr:D-alanyl-D-alanine carboxypeptidase family protein [Bacilli bacterium]